MSTRHLSPVDLLLDAAENALKTLVAKPVASRPSPASDLPNPELTEDERRLSSSLMRVNHTGEVCAQALYQGQALTAKLPDVRKEMEEAATEEIDHLAWCAERLQQLNSHISYFNPAFYALSFGIGATAGLIGDEISLGFVAATENQVCKHLGDHRERLPGADHRSRAIIEQMLIDEEKHGRAALDAGGMRFSARARNTMTIVSRLMTETTSRI